MKCYVPCCVTKNNKIMGQQPPDNIENIQQCIVRYLVIYRIKVSAS